MIPYLQARYLAFSKIHPDICDRPQDFVDLVDCIVGRSLIQRTFYLLQKCGVDFGFTYSWYQAPFSKYLNEEMYDIRNEISWGDKSLEDSSVEFFYKKWHQKMDILKDIPENFYPELDRLNRIERWFYLLAIVGYLIDFYKGNLDDIVRILSSQHPELGDPIKVYRLGWGSLKKIYD